MNPDFLLRVLAALAGYLLRTTIAFGLCFVLSRLVDSPSRRLAVWFSFLVGAAAYWLWLAKSVFALTGSPTSPSSGAFQTAAVVVGAWRLRSSWAFPVGIALRMAGIVYLAVLVYFGCDHLKKWWHLQWVLKFTTSPPAEINHRFQILADGLDVGRSRLMVLSGVSSPATFGWIRPIILLPDVCLQQDAAELDNILLHELHHVRSWDFLWNRLAMACRALVFFQPACSYALRQVSLERELACDRAVVAQTPERRAIYAECLIRFARLHADQQEKIWGVDFAASQHLKLRVHAILAESRKLPVWSACLRIACGVILLAGFVGLAPSLVVLFSYAQQQAALQSSRSIAAPLLVSPTTKIGNTRQSRFLPVRPPANSLNKSASLNEPGRSMGPEPDEATSSVISSSVAPSHAGPQLLLRPSPGSPGASNAKQQTIVLLDPGTAVQDDKAADRKQALEQSATTALGIYRRLGAVDRH